MMMKYMWKMGLLAIVWSMLAIPALAADVSYTSVLNGAVVQAIPAGTAVREGDVLVTVQSLVGPMAAARASESGVVKEVLVQPGQKVQQGTVVMVIETK